jgi:aldehyde:ferredoxin oxidoreductase
MSQHISPERVQEIKAARQILKTYQYTPAAVDKGYTNKTLYINISDNTIAEKPLQRR